MTKETERMAQEALEFIRSKVKVKPHSFFEAGVGHRGAVSFHVPRFEPWAGVDIYGCEPEHQRHAMCSVNYPGRLLNRGLWSGSGFAMLHTDRYKYASLFSDGGHSKVKITLTTLDELDHRLDFGPTVLWAAIEGSELQMLRGAANMLNQGRLLGIMLEVRNNAPVTGWCKRKQVELFLARYGYVKSHIFQRHTTHLDVLYTRP